MFQPGRRLKALKPIIRAISKENYQGIHSKVDAARKELKRIHLEVLTAPTAGLIQQEKAQLAILNDLIFAKESLLMQKSTIKWLQVGDHTTSFLHKAIKGRMASNTIKSITSAAGLILTNYDDIKYEILSHYENLLGSAGPPPPDS